MTKRHDVVVIGAGAAGLTAASALARAGAEVLLVERRQGGSPLPRATVLSVSTMELLRAWGFEERIRAAADDVEMTMLEAPTAARAAEGVRIQVGYPTAAQSSMVSPTEALCVAQDVFEEVIAESLTARPGVTVERGVEVIDVRAGAPGDGAVLTLRDTDGRIRTVEAGYVVAADGARSAVRAALGIGMTGPDDAMSGIQVVFRAPLWDVLGPHRHLLYSLTDPEGSGTLLPAGQGDRWLFGLQAGYHHERGREPSADEIRRRIQRASGVDGLDVRLERWGSADAANRSWAEAVNALWSRVPISLVGLEPVVARSLGVGARGAALVRPDGRHIAGWSTPRGAAAQLAAAVDGLLAGSVPGEPDEVSAA